jgi:hypothetical protein
VNGTELILGDPVRTPEIIDLRDRRRVARSSHLMSGAERIVNFVLRKDAIHTFLSTMPASQRQ